MADFRIYKIASTLSQTTATVSSGDNPTYGSAAYDYKNVWGIMVSSGTTGHVSMSGGGALNLSHIIVGQPLACHPSFVSCSAGTVYILA